MSVHAPTAPGISLPDVKGALSKAWSKSKAWVKTKFKPPRSVFFWVWILLMMMNVYFIVHYILSGAPGWAIYHSTQAFLDWKIAGLYRKAERDNKHNDALVSLGPHHPMWPKYKLYVSGLVLSFIIAIALAFV